MLAKIPSTEWYKNTVSDSRLLTGRQTWRNIITIFIPHFWKPETSDTSKLMDNFLQHFAQYKKVMLSLPLLYCGLACLNKSRGNKGSIQRCIWFSFVWQLESKEYLDQVLVSATAEVCGMTLCKFVMETRCVYTNFIPSGNSVA